MERPFSHRALHWMTGLVLWVGLCSSQAADREDCVEQVRLHGLLLAAKPVCPLAHYSKMFQFKAESCEETLGRTDFRRLLSEGRQALEVRIREMGKEALCAKIRKDFPWTVR